MADTSRSGDRNAICLVVTDEDVETVGPRQTDGEPRTGAFPFCRRVAAGIIEERTRLRRRDPNRRISCEIRSCPRMAHFAGRRWSWETIAWMDRIHRAFDHRKKWLAGFRPS